MAIRILSALLGCFLLVHTLRAQADFRPPLVIDNVTVVTPDGIEPPGMLIVKDGRIVGDGATALADVAERFDGQGLYLYPGWIDAEAHLGIAEKTRTDAERQRLEDRNPDQQQGPLVETRLANRRGIRADFRAAEIFTPSDKDLEQHRAAGFTTALVAPRDGIFSGTSDVVQLSGDPLRRTVLKSGVFMHGSFTTGEPGDYPRTLLGVMAQFRQVLLDTRYHAALDAYAERFPTSVMPVRYDPNLAALAPVLGGDLRYFVEADSERAIRRAIALADEFDLDIGIAGAREAWKVATLLRDRKIPLIVSIKFPEEPDETRGRDLPKPTGADGDDDKAAPDTRKVHRLFEPERLANERERLWHEDVDDLLRLHRAGIPFALRTRDFDKPGEFHKNLQLVISRGLPEEVALAALTSTPARILGLESQIGSLRPGSIANFTLRTGKLGDKKAKTRFIFIAGKKFEIKGPAAGKDKPGKDKPGTAEEDAPGHHHAHADEPDTAAADETAHADDQDDEATAEDGDGKKKKKESPKGPPPEFAVEIEADRVPRTHTGGDVLIRNARIIPVTAAEIERGDILIRAGKITAIGHDIEVAGAITEIDAEGLVAVPGLIDAHSHLGLDAVNESALAVSAEVRIADVINPTHVGIYRAVAGGVTTHHVMHGSANPIGGQNATLKLKYGTGAAEMLMDAPRTIKFATGENVTHANRCVPRNTPSRYPSTRMGVEAVYREALTAAGRYIDRKTAHAAAVDRGEQVAPFRVDLRLEALADVLRGDMAIHAHCYRSEEILRLLQVAEDFGIRVGTLHHVLEGYRIAPELARHGCGASTFSNFWAYKLEAYGAVPFNAAMMSRHGICTTVNSDSGNTIRYMGQEAAKSIRWGGLTPDESLRLVTINAARQLQIDDRVGSLEVGKDGDVALFNGHPLNTFSRCVMTLIEGEVYFEDDADRTPAEPCAEVLTPGRPDMTVAPADAAGFAIVNATVHPIAGPVIERGTVIIRDGKIADLGSNVAVPDDVAVINAAGRHVYPGLIDAGNEIGLMEIGAIRGTRDTRESADLNPHLKASSAIHPHSAHVRIARVAGTTTCLSRPAGGAIAGQSALIHLDGWTLPEMILRDPVALHVRVPSLPVFLPEDKKRQKKMKDDHEKAMRQLDETFEKAAALAAMRDAQDGVYADETDAALESLLPYVRRESPVIFRADSYKQIIETIEFADRHRLRCILDGGREAWKVADLLAEREIPVILDKVTSMPAGTFEPWDSVYRCAAALDRAGARFCFASDSYENPYDLGTMAGMAVAHGLPAERAEHALTLGAAEILGIDDVVGSIEVGKNADLIVMTATPLQTSSVLTHMFIAGRPVDLSSMHTEYYEKFSHRPEPALPPAPKLIGPPDLTDRANDR